MVRRYPGSVGPLGRAIAGAALAAMLSAAAQAQQPAWMNTNLSPDQRAAVLLRAMTLDEKITLLHGHTPLLMRTLPADAIWSSGYVAGVPRLGIPALRETDAGLGVTDPLGKRHDDGATVLPSGLAQAATWDPALARQGGTVLGEEAHDKGFNVVLAGGLDLAREPRNGRNFEYAGEDPLLAGIMVGNTVAGIQSRNVVSTVKHYALNDQETGRFVMDAEIDPSAARESDLLAFEIAAEIGDPGSVMCAYNKVSTVYACENDDLLNKILKGDWHYPGWVMSDWGGTHSTEAAALAGLDQEDGEEFDGRSYFAAPLEAAVEAGRVPQKRIDDMVKRILRALFAKGVMDHPAVPAAIDFAGDAAVVQREAEEAIVLLKNDNAILPLAAGAQHIVVIGGHADIGILGGGGGSSEVTPPGGAALKILHPEADFEVYESYMGTSPVAALRAALPAATVDFNPGTDVAQAAAAAKSADIAIVFATQWTSESVDAPNLSLPGDQDALIAAVASANPHTIVVLETGGPVLMPWRDQVAGIVEAWYPGIRGADAIARVLSGAVDPSGRLPLTFPASDDQLPRPELPGYAAMLEARKTLKQPHAAPPTFAVDYFEGANVGYRWDEVRDLTPLYPFGYGLSYTSFRYGGLVVDGGRTLTVSFDVTNTGTRAGFATPEVYSAKELPGRDGIRHLIGWQKLLLNPGETRRVSVTADARLLAHFDSTANHWHIGGGPYRVSVGRFAGDAQLTGEAVVSPQVLKP